MDYIKREYDTILERRAAKADNSYTSYLFEQGIDKILKKVGEECTEVVIAAKNGQKPELVGEISDLLYHVLVMMAERGVTLEDVHQELDRRAAKRGNLKTFHQVDKNS